VADNVISIEDIRFTHARDTWPRTGVCQHNNLELNKDGHTVICKDCDTQLSAYWVLERMINRMRDANRRIEARQAQLEQEAAKTLHYRAAKKIEKDWRGGMAPVINGKALLPEDITDSKHYHATNLKIERERRAAQHELAE